MPVSPGLRRVESPEHPRLRPLPQLVGEGEEYGLQRQEEDDPLVVDGARGLRFGLDVQVLVLLADSAAGGKDFGLQ